VILWEALAGSHPFWGVPLPQVAGTIASGAPHLSARRPDLPRRLLAIVDSALDVDPSRRPSAARLAAELREAFVARPSTRREPRRTASRRPRTTAAPRPRSTAPAVPLARRLPSAGLAAVATLVGGSLLPFWPPLLLALLALAAGAATLRAPRLGLALALAAPVFPLGNASQAAAIVYGVLALAWLLVSWREPRTGLVFCAGPLLAALGLLALLPLAVQLVPQGWRRALHAAAGVLAAAAVAGLSGRPLPLVDVMVGDLGVAGTERPQDVLHAIGSLLATNAGIGTTALALAIVALLLPRAVARGLWGIAGLGALQLVLVLVWAPSIPATGFVLGTWLLCGILVARPYVALAARPYLVAATQRARSDG
jgi:hypothetical protein